MYLNRLWHYLRGHDLQGYSDGIHCSCGKWWVVNGP